MYWAAAGRSCSSAMVLFWAAVVTLVMNGSMLEVAASCTCNLPAICGNLGDGEKSSLIAIATDPNAADSVTFLWCFDEDLDFEQIPTQLGLLTKLKEL